MNGKIKSESGFITKQDLQTSTTCFAKSTRRKKRTGYEILNIMIEIWNHLSPLISWNGDEMSKEIKSNKRKVQTWWFVVVQECWCTTSVSFVVMRPAGAILAWGLGYQPISQSTKYRMVSKHIKCNWFKGNVQCTCRKVLGFKVQIWAKMYKQTRNVF